MTMRPEMNPRLRRRLFLGLVAAAVATAVAGGLRLTPPVEVLEAKSYDLRVRLIADPATADRSIVVIAIDENSLDVYGEELGRWPWDRDAYVHLLDYVTIGGARAVVFDLLFREPDRRYPEGDTLFAEALADSRAVLAFSLSPGDTTEAGQWAANRRAEMTAHRADAIEAMMDRAALPLAGGADGGSRDVVRELPYAEPVYPLLGERALALGAVNWTPDRDGVTRHAALVFQHQGRLYPSLPLAAARLLDPARLGGPVALTRNRLTLGETRIPLVDGRIPVRWRGPFMRGFQTTYPVIPAFHVLDSYHAVSTGQEPHVPLEAFEDRVVFIAATAAGALDARATPLEPHDPGVMVHATVLDNLLQGDFLERAGWLTNLALILAIALLAALLAVAFESALVASLGGLVALVAAAAVATFALSRGVWIDLAAPTLAGAVAFAGAMVGNYLGEGRDRRRVRELFGRYVSPEYVRRLADDYENVVLGGERAPVTLLFSDIRGFTSLSERLPAETVIEMLNEYLERMAEVVFRHGGTLDKFIGDAVMAFWNAPIPAEDHATRAVEAALDMLVELESLNEGWRIAGAPARLQIGIGLNTGEAIVGNIGSLTRKLDYTAIGDTVNLAARLEGLTKEYGASIIISEATRNELDAGRYEVRALDEVRVKGKEQAVRIYEVVGGRPAPSGGRVKVATASVLALLLAVAGAPLVAAPLGAQEAPRERWTDWVYTPGSWQGARLVGRTTSNEATDSLALVARVDFFAQAPRLRAEFRRVVHPDSLDAPMVLIVDGERSVVLTRLGSTALAEHAAASDPMVQAVLRRIRQARPAPPGPARIAELGAGGAVEWVILRRPAARAEFGGEVFEMGTARRLGRTAARLGIHAMGGERSEEVVAAAGARGVARVRTVDGEILVMPDTVAVERIARVRIGLIDLDRFLRDAGIEAVPAVTPRREEGT
jgi:adenylate cyclase